MKFYSKLKKMNMHPNNFGVMFYIKLYFIITILFLDMQEGAWELNLRCHQLLWSTVMQMTSKNSHTDLLWDSWAPT